MLCLPKMYGQALGKLFSSKPDSIDLNPHCFFIINRGRLRKTEVARYPHRFLYISIVVTIDFYGYHLPSFIIPYLNVWQTKWERKYIFRDDFLVKSMTEKLVQPNFLNLV
jgi:hypothetical protein